VYQSYLGSILSKKFIDTPKNITYYSNHHTLSLLSRKEVNEGFVRWVG